MTDHDQNFKNLFLEYPRETLQLFAPEQAQTLHPEARITPVREEMLKQHLGASFRRLDVPLLVEAPDGQREAVLFALEHETDPRAFSIDRMINYCVALWRLMGTTALVPVVVFLRRGHAVAQLQIRWGGVLFLHFHYISATLASMQALQHLDSSNFVARVTLPTMHYPPERKLDVYAAATRGLIELEDDPNLRTKYADFIDIYADLSDDERTQYRERYPEEADTMAGLTERFTELGRKEGLVQGLEQGRHAGEAAVLVRLLQRRLGPLDAAVLTRIQALPLDRLDALADAVFDLGSVGDLNLWLDGQSGQ